MNVYFSAPLSLLFAITSAQSVTLTYNTTRPNLSPIATRPGTGTSINYYDDGDFRTAPIRGNSLQFSSGLGIAGPDRGPLWPENGSAYIYLLIGDSYEVSSLSGRSFSAQQIDLAEYSTVFDFARNITFEGVKEDGSIVQTVFRLDGLIGPPASGNDFQTFTFPDSFSGLQTLRSDSNPFSLDNLVLEPVPIPEPSAPVMLMSFLIALSCGRRR